MAERGLKPGRRSRSLSRATELRAKLAAWRQQPENGRKSLRAFASELGTSHQLLNFYLRGLDKWQAREYQRKADEILALAGNEHRLMTKEEQERKVAYQDAASRCHAASMVAEIWRGFEADARRGRLDPKLVRYLAQMDAPRAQNFLRMSQKAKPKKRTTVHAMLEELNRTRDSETALRLTRQLTPKEREELGALQEKRSGAKKSTNNLPLTAPPTRKSFRSA